ncbi:MAG TPA: hypothetical protein DDZ41_03745, partial [Flavobacterium sp.]|nr:hypothetical protein [Flavobacterium sp.]
HPEQNKDSVQLFLPKIDSDTLTFFVENGSYTKTFVSKYKELKTADTLLLKPNQNGILDFNDLLSFTSTTPILSFNKDKIKITKQDSIAVDFTVAYRDFEQELVLDFKKEEEEKYFISILPGAVTDFYGTTNDSITQKIMTKAFADYGNLRVNLKNVKRFPVIVELTDKSGKQIASQTSAEKTNLNFDLINPMIYTLRLIYDDNANKKWDTGNFLEKKQAEQIIYYPKEIDVRANWDVEQEFDLGVVK